MNAFLPTVHGCRVMYNESADIDQSFLLSQWTDPADTEPNIAWTRETFESLQPHMANRRYVNYLSADDAGYSRDAYGANYDRLVELKRRYDPENVFRLNQNIDPG